MQLQDLKPIHKPKKRKIVGRGGKKGTYSGRGVKGQKARAGRKLKPIIREILKKYPKLRGYKFKSKKEKPLVFNLDFFEKKFKEGEEINPELLLKEGLVSKIKGRLPKLKILGKGEIKKKLIFKGFLFSKKAKEKIEKAGGKIV
jgi:large subunit ribosomal protein L15